VRSLYDDIVTALSEHTFTIANVDIRKPYEDSPKEYPLIVVHEITNLPTDHATVSGEERTILAYQLDIVTRDCLDNAGNVVGRADASRLLMYEVSDLLDTMKVTRRTITPGTPTLDTVTTIWRGEGVLDSYGYTYRR